MITILAHYERISLFHTMEPFFQHLSAKTPGGKKLFHLTQSASWCLRHDKNSILFMERCFQHREPLDLTPEELGQIQKLRNKYKTIVFFCGQSEAGTNRLDLLPYVDRLFYKSIFTDRKNYLKNLYGKNLFADYYHRTYGVRDTPSYTGSGSLPAQAADKPELSWNIGMGSYPRPHWPQRTGTVLARLGFPRLGRCIGTSRSREPEDFSGPRRNIGIHARIDPVSCPSIAYQRRLFLDTIAGHRRQDLFLTGFVSQDQYYRELEDSKIVLSPFGWGEVCFRDFEAILAGALLFKPRMSHIKTWPDVYIPYETFVPLKWDGSDLIEKAEKYLGNEDERRRIASNAYEQYHRELSGLAERFKNLLGVYFL